MATRSIIAVGFETGIRSIYCHHDGYLSHNGAILDDYYQDPDKVAALVNLGDISVLGEELALCKSYHSQGESWEQVKPAYHKDYQQLVTDSLEDTGIDFLYVCLQNGTWAVIEQRTMESVGTCVLSEAVAELRRSQMHAV